MKRKPMILVLLFLLLIGITIVAGTVAAEGDEVTYTLTILHNNDGESQVVNAGGDIYHRWIPAMPDHHPSFEMCVVMNGWIATGTRF